MNHPIILTYRPVTIVILQREKNGTIIHPEVNITSQGVNLVGKMMVCVIIPSTMTENGSNLRILKFESCIKNPLSFNYSCTKKQTITRALREFIIPLKKGQTLPPPSPSPLSPLLPFFLHNFRSFSLGKKKEFCLVLSHLPYESTPFQCTPYLLSLPIFTFLLLPSVS